MSISSYMVRHKETGKQVYVQRVDQAIIPLGRFQGIKGFLAYGAWGSKSFAQTKEKALCDLAGQILNTQVSRVVDFEIQHLDKA